MHRFCFFFFWVQISQLDLDAWSRLCQWNWNFWNCHCIFLKSTSQTTLPWTWDHNDQTVLVRMWCLCLPCCIGVGWLILQCQLLSNSLSLQPSDCNDSEQLHYCGFIFPSNESTSSENWSILTAPCCLCFLNKKQKGLLRTVVVCIVGLVAVRSKPPVWAFCGDLNSLWHHSANTLLHSIAASNCNQHSLFACWHGVPHWTRSFHFHCGVSNCGKLHSLFQLWKQTPSFKWLVVELSIAVDSIIWCLSIICLVKLLQELCPLL